MPDGAHLVEQRGHGRLHGGLQVAHEERRLAVVGDRRRGVDPQPGGLLAGEHLVGVLRVVAVVLGEPQQGVGAQPALLGHGAHIGLGRGADHPQRLEGETAGEGVLAAGGRQEFGDGAADGAGGEPRAVLGAGRVRAQLGTATEHVRGGLLDVPCGALRRDADLLQLDPDRPAAERGEGGLSVGAGERSHGGEGVQGPVEERGERGVRVRGRGGLRGGLRLGAVGDLAALGAQLRDPLFEEVEELLHGDGPGGELKEGEHLGHRGDDLGDGGRLTVRGLRMGERPGVEEGDPAAQDGAVVAVPGA